MEAPVFDPPSPYPHDGGAPRTRTGRRRHTRRTRRGAIYGSAALMAVAAVGLFLTVLRGAATEATRPVADPAASSSAAASPGPSISDGGAAGLVQVTPSGGPTTAAPSTAAASPARSSARPAPPGNVGYEDQVVVLVNQERAKVGCKPLTADSRLTAAARGHSQDMANRNYFDHNTPEGVTPWTRITNAGYHFSTAAENIAAGQTTPAQVMNAWMNSEGHRANILNCNLRNIGVGLAYNGKHTPYWTQDFGSP
jgi:uncharacterized protein YkwD